MTATKNLTPTERLAKIAALILKAGERTGKFEPVVLTDAEVLGIYLLAVAVPENFKLGGRTS